MAARHALVVIWAPVFIVALRCRTLMSFLALHTPCLFYCFLPWIWVVGVKWLTASSGCTWRSPELMHALATWAACWCERRPGMEKCGSAALSSVSSRC
jgi:hypothetical protein